MSKQLVSQKRHFDKNVRMVTYSPGDIVWLYRPVTKRGQTHKLCRFWTGPFLILDKINEVNYRIQASPRSKPLIVHADRLKPSEGITAVDLGFRSEVAQEDPVDGSGFEPEPAPPEGDQSQSPSESRDTSITSEFEDLSEPNVRTRHGPTVRPRRDPGFLYY